jgi:hypothetical protein
MFSNKNKPIKLKTSSVKIINSKILENHENFTLNAILDISAILKKVNKQKKMVYMGYVDNISAFDGWRNMLDRQRYRRFGKSRFFRQKSILPIYAAILNSKFSNFTVSYRH